jgi:hypothetical protein
MGELVGLRHSKYSDTIDRMIERSTGASLVTDKNVYQPGNPVNKPLMHEIVSDLLLPGSRIDGFEHLEELQARAQRHKTCLVLMEHYSNFDIPNFYELLEARGEEGAGIAESIVSVAGVKLNEESRLVLAFTEIFTRVVIFPSRSVSAIEDARKRTEAERRRARINIAALRTLMRLRREGRLVLVFPSGTRYRPWDPSTTRGLKEIDTYIKFYSSMVLVAVNGNTLRPNPQGDMDEDYPVADLMLFTVGPVMRCSEFRKEAMRSAPDDVDPKQAVVDRVMARLAEMHERAEVERQRLLAEAGRS